MYVVQLHVQLHVQLLYMYYIGMMMCVLLLLQVTFNVTNSVITMNGFNNYNLAILTLHSSSPLSLSDVFMWFIRPQDEERRRMYGPLNINQPKP